MIKRTWLLFSIFYSLFVISKTPEFRNISPLGEAVLIAFPWFMFPVGSFIRHGLPKSRK